MSMRTRMLLLGLWLGCSPALASDEGGPATVLALARLDSVAIAAPGRVAGVAWISADTLAVLVAAGGEDAAGGAAAAGAAAATRLVLQDRRGRVLRSVDVTGVLSQGLAWDGASLWGAGDAAAGGARLVRLEPGLLTVAASYPTPGHRPAGACHDGRFVWVVDRDAGRLERFDPALMEMTRSTATPAFSPAGLAWDGRHLWLTDAGTGRLYRLSGSRRAWSGTVSASSFSYRGRAVHLAHDGQDLWFVPEDGRWLVRIRIS
jgi:sugar lactone lactonase YvrE